MNATKPNTSQHDHGSCKWCKGKGFVIVPGREPEKKCPKCNGTGTAPKTSHKG